MTNIYFVRHAEPNYKNHNDLKRELTDKGIRDSKYITSFLADKSINKIFSSPYKRSIDTIKDFADNFSINITIIDDFKERKISDSWIDNFSEFSQKQWSDFSYKLDDGENFKETQSRNINALNSILSKYENKNIVIGTHGTALSLIINYFDNSFGINDFNKIKSLFPWVVLIRFENNKVIEIKHMDIFS